MDEIEYSCTRCKRPIRAPRAQALTLLARKKTRCQVCGSALTFPKDVLDEFEGAHKVGASDVREEVSYSCGGCNRTYKRPLGDIVTAIVKKKTTCAMCQGSYVYPPLVHEALAKLQARGAVAREIEAECPICLRVIRGDARDPEKVLKCSYCGTKVRLPLEGGGCRLVPLEGPAASVEDVKKALAAMPADELGGVASQALLARAERGEVAKGEADALAEVHAALRDWHPEEHEDPFLPLAQDQAEKLIPALLFPGMVAYRDYVGGVLELVFTIGQSTGLTDQAVLKGVVNTLGLVTMFTVGGGIFIRGGDDTRQVQHRLRVSVNDMADGVVLGLAHQVDDGRPKVAGRKELGGLRERLIAVAPSFRNYYALLAIYGSWAAGTPCVAAVPSAIEKRLRQLGETSTLGGPLAQKAAKLAPRLKVAVSVEKT